jgi:hypothetical protein
MNEQFKFLESHSFDISEGICQNQTNNTTRQKKRDNKEKSPYCP